MKKIQKETTVSNCRMREIPKAAVIAAAVGLFAAGSGTALAYINWDGFAYISEMSEAEKEALGNGHMVVLRPEATERYSLKAGDTVAIEMESNRQQRRKSCVFI